MAEYSGHIFVILALIIIIIISLTFVVYYAFRRNACMTYPSPYCYNDWNCPGAPDDQQPWDRVMSLVNNCGIISDTSAVSDKCQNPWSFVST